MQSELFMWLISSFLGCTNRFYIKNCTAKKYWELPAMLFAWRKFNYTRPRRYFCGLFFVRRCPAFGITLQANALRVILNIARSAGPRWILGVLNPQEINFLAKFDLHGIFTKIMMFHKNPKISSPWGWPWARLNFSPEFFQKLSHSESESSWSKLVPDGRKF